MSAEIMIMIITLSSASMSIVFLISVLKENKPDLQKLTKILGKENIQKIKQTQNEDELKALIRSFNAKQKSKLKTLIESQDIRDVVKVFKEHIGLNF